MSKIDLQQKMTIAIPLYFFASINQTVCMLIMLGANQYSFEIRLKNNSFKSIFNLYKFEFASNSNSTIFGSI